MVLLRIQVHVHMTLSLGVQFVKASFMIIKYLCMPVFSPTVQILSICLYDIPQSTYVSKACFLTHDSILVFMLVFNQQFSQHGSNMQDVLYTHQGYQLP